VEAEAIGLDDEGVLTPKEVDEEGADAGVYFRQWDTVAAAEPEELELEFAAGTVAGDVGPKPKAEDLRLADGAAELGRTECSAEVGDRPSRCGDWDTESRWLRTARSPQASTAASHRPSRLTARCPTA
jgi:hypothetical protein